MQVEPHMPDRPKMRDQTKKDTGVYAVCGRLRFTSGTRLLIRLDRASAPVTTEEGPTSLKSPSRGQHNRRGPIPGQLIARAAGTILTRYRVYLAPVATKGTGDTGQSDTET